METNAKIVRNTGEDLACEYCINTLGYKIINRNYKCGKIGEIDIVCKKDNLYIFVEVKTRSSDYFMNIFDVVDYRKLQALKRAADYYILKYNLYKFSQSIDLLTINNLDNKINYYPNITSTI